MLSSVDAIKRTLTIPPRFVPYMEKHRIYELFYELSSEIIIKQPTDHILYLKQCLYHAARNRDVPRLILLAPPDFDKTLLAEALQSELGVRPVSINDIHEVTSTCMHISCADAEDFARNMKRILRTGMIHDSGWVLVDNPRNKAEAQAFQRIGIIPTHVLQINPTRAPEYTDGADTVTNFHAPMQSWNTHYRSPEQRAYRKHLRGLRDAYANFLIEVDVGDRTIKELAKDCATLARMRKHCGAPSIFRVVLIGPRGCGSRTVARYLSERFNLVHVDFEKILDQARLQDTSLGEALRMFERSWAKRPTAETRIQIVEKYILGHECMGRGWVLTGYPITVQDFRLLDMLATPPNRVIFFELDDFTCRERLLGRRVNVVTGSKHNLVKKEPLGKMPSQVAILPKDYRSRVEKDINEYWENVGAMMEYAGGTASFIDGSLPVRTVREKVESCLIRPAPCAPPREPCPPTEVKPEDVEFDPDDEPDHRIFDDIREPEPTMSLI